MSDDTTTPKAKSKVTKSEEAPSRSRQYTGAKKVDHDLFKLMPANMIKNTNWNPDSAPNYEQVIHQHFFHTYDSSGRAMVTSESVGGHFHEITLQETVAADGSRGIPKVIACSGPKKYTKQRVMGKNSKVPTPIKDDNHTHAVEYIKSDTVEVRVVNPEAYKVVLDDESKGRPVQGILER